MGEMLPRCEVGAGDGCGLTARGAGGWRRRRHAGPSHQRQREGGRGAVAVVPPKLGRPRKKRGRGERGRASESVGGSWASRPN